MNALTTAAPLSDADIYERIVLAIRDHRLAPGTKLVEDKLGSAFGVSRTRIRPVLARLANEHIVTLTPHRGAQVASPGARESREVFETRRLIEPPLLTRFIAAATEQDLARLAGCIADEEAARSGGDARRAIRLAGDFHLIIAERAGHATLERILRELTSHTSLILMAWGPAPDSDCAACGCQEHRVLLDAICLRDADTAARLMQDHLTRLEAQLRFDQRAASLDLTTLFNQKT